MPFLPTYCCAAKPRLSWPCWDGMMSCVWAGLPLPPAVVIIRTWKPYNWIGTVLRVRQSLGCCPPRCIAKAAVLHSFWNKWQCKVYNTPTLNHHPCQVVFDGPSRVDCRPTRRLTWRAGFAGVAGSSLLLLSGTFTCTAGKLLAAFQRHILPPSACLPFSHSIF